MWNPIDKDPVELLKGCIDNLLIDINRYQIEVESYKKEINRYESIITKDQDLIKQYEDAISKLETVDKSDTTNNPIGVMYFKPYDD